MKIGGRDMQDHSAFPLAPDRKYLTTLSPKRKHPGGGGLKPMGEIRILPPVECCLRLTFGRPWSTICALTQ